MLLIFQDKTLQTECIWESFVVRGLLFRTRGRTKWKVLLYDGTTMSVWCDWEWYAPFM